MGVKYNRTLSPLQGIYTQEGIYTDGYFLFKSIDSPVRDLDVSYLELEATGRIIHNTVMNSRYVMNSRIS